MIGSSTINSSIVSSRHGLEYTAYSNAGEIKQISGHWDRLLEVSTCYRAFASSEWYFASFRVDRYRHCIPFVIAASRGPDLVGILPLAINSTDRSATIPLYWSYYCDAVIRDDDLDAVVGMLSYALSFRDICERIVLSLVADDSNLVRAIPLIAAQPALECRYNPTEDYQYVALPESFDDYLRSRSRNFRKNLIRFRRRAEDSGLIVKELGKDEYDPARLAELFLSMVTARHGNEFAPISDSVGQLVHEVFPPLFAKGALRLFVILKQDEIIALDLCMARTRALGTWNGGFLAQAREWSPGTLLIAYCIERAIESGLSEYDFFRGDEDYKTRWANLSRAVGKMEFALRRWDISGPK